MARNTNTSYVDAQGNNRTATHLSTNIVVKVNGTPVGAIQEISVTENRSITMVDELGTDGHIDSAPTKSTDISGRVSRMRYARVRIFEAFGKPIVHIHAQRIPFDIEIQDRFHSAVEGEAIVTTLRNVWFENLEYTYGVSEWTVKDNIQYKAEAINSVIVGNGGNVVGAGGSLEGTPPTILNLHERQADKGDFRGAMDAAGVLNAFLADPTG